MNKGQLEIMLEGLIATAVEKTCVLGEEEAKEDVLRIIEMIEELESFWNPDGEVTNVDYVLKANEVLTKIK